MKRWWASPEDSIAALSVVDDSDVVNGAGVAFLGYHGLSQTALQPLAKETLVDTHRVRESLSKVDLEPIAKALGEATKPVMGDASERYGQLLAEEIHKRAVVATERLLNTWTTNGMPWPQAIEKAAEVHGVPLERLGRYATVMKTVGITPLVRADYADRELMAYAADFGQREAVTDNTLVIKQEKNLFKEEDHPRNPNGEFKAKEDNVSSINDKLNRLNRINRMNRINGINRKVAAAKKTESVVEKPKEESVQEKNTFGRVKYGDVKYGQVNYEKRKFKPVNFKHRTPDGPKETDFEKIDNPFKWDKTVYMPINGETFEKIKYDLKGYFFIGELDKNGIEAINEDEMEDWVKAQGSGTVQSGIEAMRSENVFLMRSNYTPVNPETMDGKYGKKVKVYDNLHEDTGSAHVVPRAKFSIVPSGGEMLEVGRNRNMLYQTYLINLENSEFEDFSKSLQSSELQNFNEEHPRGEDGKFASKDDVVDIRQARLDRINRMNRMNKINNNNRAAQMKRLLEQQKKIGEKQTELEQKFGQVEYGQKKFGQVKFGQRDFGKVNWGKLDNLNPLPKPLDLKDKFVMFAGLDSIGSILDDDLPAFIPLKVGTVLGPNDVTSPRPLINPELYHEDEKASVNKVPAISIIIADADKFYVEHGSGEKRYITDAYGRKLTFKETEEDDEALAAIFDETPNPLSKDNRVWQPFVETVENNYGELTDLITVGWESNDSGDAVQMVLGDKDDFDALREGNATIEPIEGIECLADLLLKTTHSKGLTFTPEEVFEELFTGGGRNNIGTNPPVSAYIIKIGQNS